MFRISTIVFLVLTCQGLQAHPLADTDAHEHHATRLAAAEVQELLQETAEFTGPAETSGIASIEAIGLVDLGAEFSAMTGRQFRARVFTIEPGGIVGIHTHDQRPGFAYILSGSIIEHRSDTRGAIQHEAGSISVERSGLSHWWENISDAPVKALIVDIFTLPPD